MGSESGFVGCDCAMGGGFPSCSEFWRLGRFGTPEGRAHQDEAIRRERQARAAQTEHGDWQTQLSRMGVPREALVALGRLQENALTQAARRFFGAPPGAVPMLALMGSTGLGKTVAAALVLQLFAKRWDWNGGVTGDTTPPAVFLPARMMTRLSSFDEADRRLFADARRCRLLVVDDLGDEATDFAKGHVVDLLMERIDANRRTVLTSNLKPGPFRQRYGHALSDRIQARSLAPKLEGESLRKRAAP